MKNVSRPLAQTLSLLLIFGIAFAPTTGFSGMSCAAKSLCNNSKDAISQLIEDPKCKADAACVKCVGTTLGDSQLATYCTAYDSTTKSKKKQDWAATIYYTTSGICLTSCALKNSEYGKALGETLAKVCTGLGVAAAGYDIISALAANDVTGGLLGLVGAAPALTSAVSLIANKAGTDAIGKAKKNSCLSGATFLLLAVAKSVSTSKMKDAAKGQCDVLANFGKSAGAAVQSCQLGKDVPQPESTGGAGFFAATSETFSAPKIDDVVKELGVTASDQFIKDMRSDFDTMDKLGKLHFDEVAKKVDDGASPADIMSSFGLGSNVAALADNLEGRIKSGEKIRGLDALSGGYSAPGAGLASTGGGTSEMGFGNAGAAPGGASATLDIDRKPASVASALGTDGDILHSAFSGSIFDIISLRIKEQKSQYADAEPEGRMNRVFNGYTDRNRKPATKSGR